MEQLPIPKANAWACLYKNVTNANDIKQALISASKAEDDYEREKVDYAFIDASLVTSQRHLITAVLQALIANASNATRTNTVHSEVIFQLEPSNNITDAFRHFGVGPKTQWLVVVKVGTQGSDSPSMNHLNDLVKGDLVQLDTLDQRDDPSRPNWNAIRKLYKLNNDSVLKNANANEIPNIVDDLCTSMVALKQVAA